MVSLYTFYKVYILATITNMYKVDKAELLTVVSSTGAGRCLAFLLPCLLSPTTGITNGSQHSDFTHLKVKVLYQHLSQHC